MCIAVQREGDGRMSQTFRDHLRINARLKRQCCVCVAEVVKPDAWEPQTLRVLLFACFSQTLRVLLFACFSK